MDTEPSQKVTQEQKESVAAFKHYLVPGNFYNALSLQAKRKPYVLRRSFSYSQASAAAAERTKTQRHRCVQITIGITSDVQSAYETPGPLGHAPLEIVSVLAVLCRPPTNIVQDYVPCSASLLHVPVKGTSVAAALRLPSDLVSGRNLPVIFIVARNCMDVTGIGVPHGKQLAPNVTMGHVLALLRPNEAVLWGSHASVRQTSSMVSLQPATLRVHCAGTVVNGYPPRETSAISFEPCIPAVPAAMSLQVGVAMTEADMPLPPQLRAPRQPDKLDGPLGKIWSDRYRSRHPPCGTVFFKYYSFVNARCVTETAENFACPFCPMECQSFLGLEQHLEASHDMFMYGYSDEANALRTVVVEPKEELYTPGGEFQALENDALRDPVNKEFSFFCPTALRKLRLQQRRSIDQTRAIFPLPSNEAPVAKRARLTQLASTRGAAQLQEEDGDAVPVRRRARRGGAPSPAVFDPVEHYQRLYHARTAVQMKQQELAAIMADPKAAPDSDDEEDIEEWKQRSRRKLAPRTDLCQEEKVFMFNWNVHLRNHPVHADSQVPASCMDFSSNNRAILGSNAAIRRIFVLHLVNLYEYGLLTPHQIDDCLKLLDEPVDAPRFTQ
ncbi:g8442 [Coccomyxa elongata]